ncbi:hypothetical protein JRQ81_015970 [Phrynocephalus forsythii]|uniref:Interferon gamma n=1 Tax=Phrynocephalus forsythii TaxID=171643 RepID=A0A9Q1B1Y1_9SAUR|nr:hypothetical protein JRQ81_015970 [Phrynocephalus forsythii]
MTTREAGVAAAVPCCCCCCRRRLCHHGLSDGASLLSVKQVAGCMKGCLASWSSVECSRTSTGHGGEGISCFGPHTFLEELGWPAGWRKRRSGQAHRTTFADIKESITQLEKEFNATQSDIADDGFIFLKRLSSSLWSQVNERKILLAQMISTYLELLNTAPQSQTTSHVKDLLEALNHYKGKYSESLRKANDIIEVSKIPLSDVKIQRKVVSEMYNVLLEVNKEENRRKRRSGRQNPRGQIRCRPNVMG